MPERKLSYEQLLAENKTLREENQLLKQKTGFDIAEPQPKSIEEKSSWIVPSKEGTSDPFQNTTVTQSSSTDDKIDLFLSLFRGREDVYAKRWYSSAKETSGYQPVCLNEWKEGVCDKKSINATSVQTVGLSG